MSRKCVLQHKSGKYLKYFDRWSSHDLELTEVLNKAYVFESIKYAKEWIQ